MIINLLYLAVPGALVLVYIGNPVNSVPGIIALLAALFVSVLYLTGVSGITFRWSKYERTWSKDFFNAIREKITHALLLYLITAVMLAVGMFIPYFLSLGSTLYLGLTILGFWILFFSGLALQFYLPLAMYIKTDSPFKTLKKSFILLSDNVAFSAWLFVKTLADAAVSVVSVTLIPGICGISLSQMDALRLVLIRYNYTENNPGAVRRNLDWKTVFAQEAEQLGR